MDQLTAHLDRGWDLAQSGDARGAVESARRALELSPDSPEAYNLLGYAAALDGDFDEALEAYQQALALDDGYVEAMLSAAEVLLHPVRDFEQAVELCDRVLELSDYDDEILDAQLLKFDAYWAMGEDDEARKVVKRLPRGPFESPAQSFLVARACIEVGEFERARPLLQAALEGDPGNSETSYYAGLLAEADGDLPRASMHFLRTRQLEAALGLPPWSPNEQAFSMFVERATAELPPEQHDRLRHAQVFVVDLPGPEAVVDGVDVRAMVLIDVLASPSELNVADGSRIRVFLYAMNILRTAGSIDAVEATIRDAIARELEALQGDARDTHHAS
ncbi:MAG: tetratricopeptide repeat protein [Deltaproteobacteria bacterium]|nr:tetratricopeptide repeat protein [Deltaproteobacteria bacterium]